MHGKVASLLSEMGYKVTFQVMKALPVILISLMEFFSILDSIHACFLKFGLPENLC